MKYNRKLGSKKEQKIITPKQPRYLKCGCIKYHDGKKYFLKYKCTKKSCKL